MTSVQDRPSPTGYSVQRFEKRRRELGEQTGQLRSGIDRAADEAFLIDLAYTRNETLGRLN